MTRDGTSDEKEVWESHDAGDSGFEQSRPGSGFKDDNHEDDEESDEDYKTTRLEARTPNKNPDLITKHGKGESPARDSKYESTKARVKMLLKPVQYTSVQHFAKDRL